MVGSPGRGVVSPDSVISSEVTAVCEVVVVAGACAPAVPAPNRARSNPQHNVRTDTTPLFSGRVDVRAARLNASPRGLAPRRSSEPYLHYSHLPRKWGPTCLVRHG